jgi:DMSO/TMAO reductase YedYZ heme-binding membrane subunit
LTRFDNNRLSHWLASALITWVLIFLIWALPIFHLWLRVPTSKVAMYTAFCCMMQLVITPWLFSARATDQNPRGQVGRRAAALTVLFTGIALLLFCYIPLSLHKDPDTRLFATISFTMTLLLALAALTAARMISRRHGGSTKQ